MERHKGLYKDNSTLLSPKVQRLNRERLAIRTKQRNDQYYSTRKISVSPTPHKKMPKQEVETAAVQVTEENKENGVCEVDEAPVVQESNASAMHSSRIAKVACKTDGQKWTRQEMFLQRFIHWKETKKAQLELKKQQRHLQKKPFVPAGGASNKGDVAAALTTTTSTFAPKNHKFTAPEGLQNPAETVKPKNINKAKQRQSLYTVVPTPEKKKKEHAAEQKKLPLARKVLLANQLKTPGAPLPGTTPNTEKTTITKTQQHKTPNVLNGVTTVNKQRAKAPAITTTLLKKPTEFGPTATTATASAKPEAQRFAKPRPLILPPPPPKTTVPAVKGRARIVKPIRGGGGSVGKSEAVAGGVAFGSGISAGNGGTVGGGGAVGKAKAAAASSTKVNVKNAVPITKPKLAISMKAKKLQSSLKSSTIAGDKKKLPAKFKLNKQTLLEVANQKNLPIAETPNDVYNNVNPFAMFVTSTKRKSHSNSQNALEFLTLDTNISDTISPVEPLEKVSSRTSVAKRQLIQEKLGETEAKPTKDVVDTSRKSKFNFVRYSVVPSEIQDEQTEPPPAVEQAEVTAPNELKTVECLEQKPVEDEHKEQAPLKTAENPEISSPPKTPTGVENGERPINYLSPFVSVTRGKVNSKVEKEKRNSIYLQSDALAHQEQEKETQEALLLMRRTLETVRYFRKQLKDETDRLHAICDKWEAYKTENLTQLQETGGEDMINVTIGQTKLLTSKKFMQFSGLIDRCEAGVTAPHLLVNDGSEKTKPITATDLEGFWCMVGLQVDNVEKRFDNLERWRANNWLDPDDVKPIDKQPKQLAKTKKSKTTSVSSNAIPKAKPKSALQQMLRKMHADMRKNKAAIAAATTTSEEGEPEVVGTPTGKRRSHSGLTPQRISSPHRRISIVVKDRKLHSAAPTILTINTPNRRHSLRNRTNSPQQHDSPKLLTHVQNFRRSVTHLQNFCGERNELWKSALKGADQQRRMSLMATPPPNPNTPPAVAKGRKSILKTPGTAKGKPKNVIFNEELRIKKFKFTIDSDHSDEEEARRMSANSDKDETDAETRTYTLRTRKVILRPSGDFELPK